MHVSSSCALCLGCLPSFFDAWRVLVVAGVRPVAADQRPPAPRAVRRRPGGCGPPPTNGRRVFYVSRLPLVWILQSSARACKPIYCERQTRPGGRKRPPPGVFVALPFLPDDDCSGLTLRRHREIAFLGLARVGVKRACRPGTIVPDRARNWATNSSGTFFVFFCVLT